MDRKPSGRQSMELQRVGQSWSDLACSTEISLLGILLLLFNGSVMPNSLHSHGLQDSRLPCPSLSPGACSNWVDDAIQPSCPVLYPSPPAFNLSQHQLALFKLAKSLRARITLLCAIIPTTTRWRHWNWERLEYMNVGLSDFKATVLYYI